MNWFHAVCQSTTFLDLFPLYHQLLPHFYIISNYISSNYKLPYVMNLQYCPISNNNPEHLCAIYCVPGIILSV